MPNMTKTQVWQMVKEAVAALGCKATNIDVSDWIVKKYPGTNPATIACHIMESLEIIKLYRMKPVKAQAVHKPKAKPKPKRRPAGLNETCAVCKRSVFLLDLQNHLRQHFNIVFISEPGASFSDQLDSLHFFRRHVHQKRF